MCFRRISWMFAISYMVLLLLACKIASAASEYASPPIPKQILIISSYHQGYAWTDSLVQGVEDVIIARYGETDFYFEYMDILRRPELADSERVSQFRRFYDEIAFDGIITVNTEALRFVSAWHDSLFPNIPVVFCGVYEQRRDLLENQHSITGLFSLRDNYLPTIRNALDLKPNARYLAFIAESSPIGDSQWESVSSLFADSTRFPGIDLIAFRGDRFTHEELYDTLKTLPPDGIAFLGLWETDRMNRRYSSRYITGMISNVSPIPVFGISDQRLGFGIVGGKLNSGKEQGKATAHVLCRILDGEHPSDIPVETVDASFFGYDYNELKRWGIHLSALPRESIVINAPSSFYARNKGLLLGVIAGFTLLLVVIMVLLANIVRRHSAERALLRQKNLLHNVLANVPFYVYWKDTSLRYLGCNTRYAELAGYASPDELIGNNDSELFLPISQWYEHERQEREIIDGGVSLLDGEFEWTIPGNRVRKYRVSRVLLRDTDGMSIGVLGIYEDITDRKRLEDVVAQTHKLESIGRLAGGIAHDFNNLLTVISGNAEIALLTPDIEETLRRDIEEIRLVTDRAASLTRQLLAFSRRQILKPRLVDMSQIVFGMHTLLRRLIGENIELAIIPSDFPLVVRADTGQLEQVVTNLTINARDAMPDGGIITLAIDAVTLDDPPAQSTCLPGEFVRLRVSDTGTGMDEEVLANVFEPFFTTKEKGKGTGLGLPTSHGIVSQHGGCIIIESTPGVGSTISVYLPRVDSHADADETTVIENLTQVSGGSESILLVEDEPSLRAMIGRVLKDKGYHLLTAMNGEDALIILERESLSHIDLLVTDVVMPRMGGIELADRLTAMMPGVRVLFMSGYTDLSALREGVWNAELHFIQKPFTPADMVRKVRQVLDDPLPSPTNGNQSA